MLVWVFDSCKEVPNKSSTFNKKEFSEHYIDEIKGTLLLPNSYARITPENQTYVFSKLDSTSSLMEVVNFLNKNRLDYILFTKRNDSDDFILIRKTDHVNFSKEDANRYLGAVESVISESSTHLNYTRLQNKISRTERSKYIKLKYEFAIPNGSIYRTQYLVTSIISTFEVLEIRRDISDFEDLIKRISYIVN